MEFNNKLYQLRKQKGLSQEELANRLNVSRQTISKWEVGDSTPDMEKLIAISDLFEISLDELILDKKPETINKCSTKPKLINEIKDKVFTKKVLKIIGIVFAIIMVIDIVSMIVYFGLYGFPK